MKGKYTEKQKLARELYRELEKLRDISYKLGYHKLDKPIQKGWLMEFEIREDILRSSDGKRYLEILPIVQNRIYSRTTIFNSRDLEKFSPKCIRVSVKESDIFPEFFWDKYFVRGWDFSRPYRTGLEIRYPQVYMIQRPHVFQTVVKENYITQLKIIDPVIEGEIDRIENKIRANNLWPVIYKIKGWSNGSDWPDDSQELLLRELEKEVRQELNLC